MRWFKYDYVGRPNFEFYACCGWIAGCVGTLFYLARHYDYPLIVIEIMLIVCFAMASWRGISAMQRFRVNQRMRYQKPEKISWRCLRWRCRRNKVWMGRGFPWGSEEIQKAWDYLKSAPAKKMQASKGQWIHGLVGVEEKIQIPLELFEGNTLIVGTTGIGKTRLLDLLIAQSIIRGERVMIIDPKADHDLRDNARKACEAYRGPEAFAYFHPVFPEESVLIDPLRNWNRATEIASRVAALIPSETEGDPFTAFGWMALNAIIEGLVYIEKRPNLVSLRRYIEIGPKYLVMTALEKYYEERIGKEWKTKVEKAKSTLMGGKRAIEDVDVMVAYYNYITSSDSGQACTPEQAVDGLIRSYLHNREHYQKMIASLMPILSMITSGYMRELLSPQRREGDNRRILDLKTVVQRNMVLYLGLDGLSDSTVGSAIGSIMLADLTAVASDIYNFPGMDKPPIVNVFIDEMAEVINNPAIQMLNKGRGAGFRVFTAMQTLADLQVRTGSEAGARQVLGNTNNWIIMKVLDSETQKYISEALPKMATKSLDIGYRSASGADAPSEFSATYTESLKETEKELLPPALLGMLPKGHYFCRLSDSTTWKGRLPILQYKGGKS